MPIAEIDNTGKEMHALVDGLPTKSAKIRKLGSAGYSRKQIAAFLDIRYQHVRNVLVDAARVAGGQAAEPSHVKPPQFAVRVEIGANGDVTIPAHILAAAGAEPGQFLLARFDDDEIRLVTPAATKRKVQSAVRRFVPAGVSLVDELLRERRREVAHEQSDA